MLPCRWRLDHAWGCCRRFPMDGSRSGTLASCAWCHSLPPPRTFEDVYLGTQTAILTTETVCEPCFSGHMRDLQDA